MFGLALVFRLLFLDFDSVCLLCWTASLFMTFCLWPLKKQFSTVSEILAMHKIIYIAPICSRFELCLFETFIVLIRVQILLLVLLPDRYGMCLCTSKLIVLLPSAVISSMKISETVPSLAIHAQVMCFTDEVVCFGSFPLSSILYSCPSLWYKLIFISSVHNTFFYFFQLTSVLHICSIAPAFLFMKSSAHSGHW